MTFFKEQSTHLLDYTCSACNLRLVACSLNQGSMILTKTQKEILSFLQKDIPLESRPYRDLAQSLRLSEDLVIKEIKRLKTAGYIRRLGGILNHNKIGFKENCMCVWNVPARSIKKIVRAALRKKEISHCYLRKTAQNWPFNFYTMIHAKTKTQCRNIARNIAAQVDISAYKMLFTIKEFKKISPEYIKNI